MKNQFFNICLLRKCVGLTRRCGGAKWLVAFCILGTGCKKMVVVNPPQTQLVASSVFASDAAATSAVMGIYSQLISSNGFASEGANSFSFFTGLSGDELTNYASAPELIEFYTNSLSVTNSRVKTLLWQEGYNYIYQANAVIQGLELSKDLTAPVKSQLLGEARFMRAFCYFYLVNLFGNIPLALSTDYRINNGLSRKTESEIYASIIADLLNAQNLLSNYYPDGSNKATVERVRPNKWVATAFLARVYLYTKDWSNAETQASLLINNSGTFNLVSNPDSVFLKNSTEAIWQLMPVLPGYVTNEARTYILNGYPNNAALSDGLLQSFEPGDKRKVSWINSIGSAGQTYYFPYKYKVIVASSPKEYSMVLRLAEQYLIRAEARVYLNRLSGTTGAESDINTVRVRAGLLPLTITSQSQALAAIEQERRVELFTEYGHRWMDLKRTGRANVVLQSIKLPNWTATDTLYPIPQSEILINPKLTQNAGY